jgi:hypothetical protein
MAENYKQVSGDFQTPATEKEKAEETEIVVNEGVETNVNLSTIKDVREIVKESSDSIKLFKHNIMTQTGNFSIVSTKSTAYSDFEEIRSDNTKLTSGAYLVVTSLPSSGSPILAYFGFARTGPDSFTLQYVAYNFSNNTASTQNAIFLGDEVTKL